MGQFSEARAHEGSSSRARAVAQGMWVCRTAKVSTGRFRCNRLQSTHRSDVLSMSCDFMALLQQVRGQHPPSDISGFAVCRNLISVWKQ